MTKLETHIQGLARMFGKVENGGRTMSTKEAYQETKGVLSPIQRIEYEKEAEDMLFDDVNHYRELLYDMIGKELEKWTDSELIEFVDK